MSEKEQVLKEKLEHSGLFDFKGFYSFAHAWLEEEGYDTEEEKYNEKVSGNSRDIYFEWKSTKESSDYFKREIKFKFDIKELTDVEVEIDGKKKKMSKGKIKIEIKGTIISDYDSKWDATPTYRFLRDTYNKFIVPNRVNSVKDMIKADVITLKEEFKAYLELSGRRK